MIVVIRHIFAPKQSYIFDVIALQMPDTTNITHLFSTLQDYPIKKVIRTYYGNLANRVFP